MATMLFSVAIVLAVATFSSAGALGKPNPLATDQSLLKYMMQSTFSTSLETSALCFGYYIPILYNVTEEFSRTFQLCATAERDRIDKLNNDAITDRYQIESAADNVCVRLSNCNNYVDALKFFDCFAAQGSEDTRILYVVTQNSTDKGGELREQYRLADLQKYKCQNASERVYVESTARTYKQLDICLKIGEVPTTASPDTTTQPTTTTIKEEETTTTQKIETTETSTKKEPEETTQLPPVTGPQEDLSNGRGLKLLSELQTFWRKLQ